MVGNTTRIRKAGISRMRTLVVSSWAMGLCLIVRSGCGRQEAEFSANRVYLRLQESRSGGEYAPQQVEDIANALAALFGEPDKPYLVRNAEGIQDAVDLDRLQAAAGSVGSDQLGQARGLYRQHCVHCHGISGDGRGPMAAFLNPYPRDFRMGTFKFKSTPIGMKPTDDDLRRVLIMWLTPRSICLLTWARQRIRLTSPWSTHGPWRGAQARRQTDWHTTYGHSLIQSLDICPVRRWSEMARHRCW